MKILLSLVVTLFSLSSFAKKAEVGDGNPYTSAPTQEPQKEISYPGIRKCLAMIMAFKPEQGDVDPLITSGAPSSQKGVISVFMAKHGFVGLRGKDQNEADALLVGLLGKLINLDKESVIDDPQIKSALMETASKRPEQIFKIKKNFTITNLTSRAKKKDHAPGSAFLNEAELKHLKASFCSCEELKVNAITAAARKSAEEHMHNEEIKVQEPNSKPRVLTEEDLTCGKSPSV